MFFDVTEHKMRAKVTEENAKKKKNAKTFIRSLTRNMVRAYLNGHSNKTLLLKSPAQIPRRK